MMLLKKKKKKKSIKRNKKKRKRIILKLWYKHKHIFAFQLLTIWITVNSNFLSLSSQPLQIYILHCLIFIYTHTHMIKRRDFHFFFFKKFKKIKQFREEKKTPWRMNKLNLEFKDQVGTRKCSLNEASTLRHDPAVYPSDPSTISPTVYHSGTDPKPPNSSRIYPNRHRFPVLPSSSSWTGFFLGMEEGAWESKFFLVGARRRAGGSRSWGPHRGRRGRWVFWGRV